MTGCSYTRNIAHMTIPRLICIHVQRGPRPLMLTRGRDLRFTASLLPERVPDWCKPWPASRDPFLNSCTGNPA